MAGPFAFAWAGGTIQDPVAIVTNGNTHGAGRTRQISLVGDLKGQQLVNIASTQSLNEGALYFIDGPNIADGTFFIFDTSILVGEQPNSVNLSAATSGDILSATFILTEAFTAGELIGTVSSGSNVVIFAQDPDLAAGVYGISGEPIGQTPAPLPVSGGTTTTTTSGDEQVLVSSAYFRYSGGLSAQMKYLAATKHTTTGIDIFGQPIEIVHYEVAEQDVKSVATGDFPVQITGAPDTDWFSITNIPVGVLNGLTPNLRYNIAGNGIQIGSTFLAPPIGATSIELDLPASTTEINAILTITGPRTPSAPFDPAIHNRFDELVLGFQIEQAEGNFATLTLDLKNPAVGLLAVGRNLWCWLSYDQNWPDGTPDFQPIFTGRLIGVPKLQAGEVIQLQFLARPDDYNVQKVALAQSMQVLPFYDPVWLATNVNPDTVLESYSALFHVDRVSLNVTASDILVGEDGAITIGEDQAFYDSFSLEYGQPPLTAVTLSGTVSWTQEADGLIDVTGKIWRAFRNAGSVWSGQDIAWSANLQGFGSPGFGYFAEPGGMLISTINGSGLFSDWPKPGTTIGAGWSLTTLNDSSGLPYCYIRDANRPLGWLQQLYYNVTTVGAPPAQAGGTSNPDFTQGFSPNPYVFTYTWAVNNYQVRMVLQYKAARKRTETVAAVMVADVQAELSDPGEQDRDAISLTSEFVSQGVDPGGGIPIGDLSRRSYFQTDRGAGSFEYLLLLGRAKMRARARAVDITFGVSFPTALGITLRNSVVYFDRRLPGGSAVGKVKSYRITVGEGGMFGEFTIGCSIGNGNPTMAAVGVNSYVEDGYVELGYQVIAGGQYSLLAEELAYQTLDDFVIDDDGIDFSNFNSDTAVNECIVTNGLTTTLNTLREYQGQFLPAAGLYGDPNQALRTLKTTVTLDLKPVAGSEFHTDFFPAVSLLALPKTIDLAARTDMVADWDTGLGGSIWDSGSSIWDQPPP